MAGPHVAGLVALLISARPDLAGNVDGIENVIEQTAVQLTSAQTCGGVPGSQIPNNTFGYGRFNAASFSSAVCPEEAGAAGVTAKRSRMSRKMIDPRSRIFCTQPRSTVRAPTSASLRAPQVCVRARDPSCSAT